MFKQGIYKESYAIHRYGFEVILSTTINILLIVGCGAISHKIPEAIIYCLSFWLIRKFCGGYHCKTYFTCISFHVVLFAIYLFTFSYYEYIRWYVYLFAFIVFLIFSPIKNRKCEKEEYLKYKGISLAILIVYILLSQNTQYSSLLVYVILIVSLLMAVCIRNNET